MLKHKLCTLKCTFSQIRTHFSHTSLFKTVAVWWLSLTRRASKGRVLRFLVTVTVLFLGSLSARCTCLGFCCSPLLTSPAFTRTRRIVTLRRSELWFGLSFICFLWISWRLLQLKHGRLWLLTLRPGFCSNCNEDYYLHFRLFLKLTIYLHNKK